jgi:zinc protease
MNIFSPPDWKIMPVIKPVTEVFLPLITRLDLPNGVPVFYIEAGQQEVVRIEVLFDAGINRQVRPLVASFSNALLTAGAGGWSAGDLAARVDFFGAYLYPVVDRDYAGMSLLSLNKHLSETVPLLREVILNPDFSEQEFGLLLQRRKQQFEVDGQKVKVLAQRRFNEILFGKEHPFGKSVNSDHFDSLTLHDLKAFYNAHYSYLNCRIYVAGKVDERLHGLLEQAFGKPFGADNWSGNQMIQMNPDVPGVYHVSKPGAIQSAIRIGKGMIGKKHPDYQSMKVVTTILGGYFGSRLMNNIREDKGYTYGIGALLGSVEETGFFSIQTEVGSEVTSAALHEIIHEIKSLQESPVDLHELDRVKNYMSGEVLRNVDGPFHLAEVFRSLEWYGLDFDWYRQMLSTIRKISPDEVLRLSRIYLDPETMYKVTAGEVR